MNNLLPHSYTMREIEKPHDHDPRAWIVASVNDGDYIRVWGHDDATKFGQMFCGFLDASAGYVMSTKYLSKSQTFNREIFDKVFGVYKVNLAGELIVGLGVCREGDLYQVKIAHSVTPQKFSQLYVTYQQWLSFPEYS